MVAMKVTGPLGKMIHHRRCLGQYQLLGLFRQPLQVSINVVAILKKIHALQNSEMHVASSIVS
jgi:hypothetical protein